MTSWLIETPRGWVEPLPPECACGTRRQLVGSTAFGCGGGPMEKGYRTWECFGCGVRAAVGFTGLWPFEEYGYGT